MAVALSLVAFALVPNADVEVAVAFAPWPTATDAKPLATAGLPVTLPIAREPVPLAVALPAA
jgi:hypothetical protein